MWRDEFHFGRVPLAAGRKKTKEREIKAMPQNHHGDHSLILVTVNQGYTEDVMNTARAAVHGAAPSSVHAGPG